MKSANCPTTKLFNDMKERFHKGWDVAKKQPCRSSCIDRFEGKIPLPLLEKLRKDKTVQQEIERGMRKDITILFADIRGFTRRTEKMPPDRIVTLLDLFIPEMLHIIINRHKGMVDKLLGDGIMALYGHPYADGQAELQALYSAIDMHQAAAAMGDVLVHMEYDPLQIGVGINSGEVLICQIGNDTHRENTVIGAPVNTAAKLEDIALPEEIAVSADFADRAVNAKKDIMPYFASKTDSKHGLEAMSFNWTAYLSGNHRAFEEWEVIR